MVMQVLMMDLPLAIFAPHLYFKIIKIKRMQIRPLQNRCLVSLQNILVIKVLIQAILLCCKELRVSNRRLQRHSETLVEVSL